MVRKAIDMSKDKAYRLAGIFFLCLLAFNFPMINIFGKGKFLWGIPAFYLYIFVTWLILIALFYYFVDSDKRKKGKSDRL